MESNKLESNERAITSILFAVVEKQLDIMYLGRIKINSGKYFRFLLTFKSVFIHKEGMGRYNLLSSLFTDPFVSIILLDVRPKFRIVITFITDNIEK